MKIKIIKIRAENNKTENRKWRKSTKAKADSLKRSIQLIKRETVQIIDLRN